MNRGRIVLNMLERDIPSAIRAESAALGAALAGVTSADLHRPSPCPPWTVGELACHVVIGARRIAQASREPADHAGTLVTTAGYYRPDERFSATVDEDRIESARALARQLGTPDAIRAEFAQAATEAVSLLADAPAGRTVRTRHGDWMLLTDFARTRVVELGVHGMDLAAGLGRPPWLTGEAAAVLEDLLLPGGGTGQLLARLRCDRAGLIARLTGRVAVSPAEAAALRGAGAVRLALS